MDLSIVVQGHQVSLLGVLGLGAGVGVIAGMFGVGGGFLLVPLLNVFLGVPLTAAVAAGLCQTIATGLGSFLRYRSMGHAESRMDILLIGGSVIGVTAGTRLLHSLDDMGRVAIGAHSVSMVRLVLTIGYVVLFIGLAGIMWFKTSPPPTDEPVPGLLARMNLRARVWLPVARMEVSGPVVGLVGLANGVLAGMLGIGGGIVLIPIMMYGFGFDIRQTAGTGTIVVLVVAVMATVQNALAGSVHLGLAMTLMVGAALAAQVGATLTRSLPAVLLRRGLAVVLMLTNVIMVYKVLRG
jgi:uncharacterized membrane protein YfcA